LLTPIKAIDQSLRELSDKDFIAEFRFRCGAVAAALQPVWDEKWREVCNGEKPFEDMKRDGHIRGDLLKFKRRIITEMRVQILGLGSRLTASWVD
jgi:hypothetical protein